MKSRLDNIFSELRYLESLPVLPLKNMYLKEKKLYIQHINFPKLFMNKKI